MISRPFQVDKKPTRVWAYIIVVSIWIYSTVFSSLPLFGIGKYVPEGYLTSCSFDYLSTDWNTRVFILSFFVAAWVIPLSIIVSCYTAIVRYVSRASREFPGQHLQRRRKQPDHEPLRDDTANKKREYKLLPFILPWNVLMDYVTFLRELEQYHPSRSLNRKDHYRAGDTVDFVVDTLRHRSSFGNFRQSAPTHARYTFLMSFLSTSLWVKHVL